MQRITIEGIRNHPWFQVNYIPVLQSVEEKVSLDDVRAVFDDIEVRFPPLLPSLSSYIVYKYSEHFTLRYFFAFEYVKC